jgi:nicotinamidase-related amidase
MKKALIVIDIQRDYFPGGQMALHGIESAARNCRLLLEKFRPLKMPTFSIQHIFTRPDAPFFLPNTPGAEIHPDLAPTAQDMHIVKNNINSFRGTDLLQKLEKSGAKEVVICGAMSHMCVDAAVRAAFDFGYHCTLVHDACATRALEYNGVTVPAEQVHAAYMAALSYAYADVVSTEEALSRLDQQR